MSAVSVVLIVRNEEKKLEKCLLSLQWADEIVIVDSESSDRTLEIARKYASKIYQRSFDHFSNQKNFGIEKATGEWILSIDADEIVTPELKDSIRQKISGSTGYDGFYVTRRNIIFGKDLRFAGQHTEKILRLFRKSKGQFIQPIHERVEVKGSVGNLDGLLIHDSTPYLEDYMRKLNRYTDYEARWLYEKQIHPQWYDFNFKPVGRFIYYYFLRLGFLDGYEGFLYHVLSSFYYFLKYAKLRELYHA